MKKLISLPMVMILISLLFWGCEKKGDPPVLPPVESMTIDFGEFISSGTLSFQSSGSIKGTQAVDNTNRIIAYAVAVSWTSRVGSVIILPVAAFNLAVQNKPDYLDNRKWQWKYSVQASGKTYIARLTGQIMADEVKWEMYLSMEGAGGFGEFLWFEGTTALDGKSGQWLLKESPQNQVQVLQIDWKEDGTMVGSVKYKYVKTGDKFEGSTIEYGLTSNSYNAFYNVYFYEPSRDKFLTVNIEWSTTLHSGRIKAPDYFPDGLWHCWNEQGNDAACPVN